MDQLINCNRFAKRLFLKLFNNKWLVQCIFLDTLNLIKIYKNIAFNTESGNKTVISRV